MYREHVERLTHFLAETLGIVESGGILLSGDDALGSRHDCKGVVDELDVLGLEMVVVAERQWLDIRCAGSQVVHHLFGRCDASQ